MYMWVKYSLIAILVSAVLTIVVYHYTAAKIESVISPGSANVIYEKYEYVVPSVSSMQLSYDKQSISHLMEFVGRQEITTDYEIVFERESEYRDGMYARIQVDDLAVVYFPYMKHHGPILGETVFVSNALDFSHMLLGHEGLSLYRGKDMRISGRATILIKKYSMGYECDSPAYSIEVYEAYGVDTPGKEIVLSDDYGC